MLIPSLYRSLPHIPQVHIPEEPVKEIAAALRVEINRAIAVLREIASGRDLKSFLYVCLTSTSWNLILDWNSILDFGNVWE